MTDQLFTRHLKSVNESYLEHMAHAMSFAVTMAYGAVVCFVHALLPFLFERSGSDCIRHLHDRMVINRVKDQKVNDDAGRGLPAAQ